jgi:hypothetical protein
MGNNATVVVRTDSLSSVLEDSLGFAQHLWNAVQSAGCRHAPMEADATCTDCGVKVGGYHHPGCDQEECPQCSMQLQCDCIPTEEN